MSVDPAFFANEPVVIPARSIPPLSVGLQDAARLLGISDSHLEKFVATGEIPVARIGTRRLFRVASLDKFLQDRERAESKQSNGAGGGN